MRTIPVRGHYRRTRHGLVWVYPSVRRIADANPEQPVRIHRDDRTGVLFSDMETICALGSMPDGAVITGSLLQAARMEWR